MVLQNTFSSSLLTILLVASISLNDPLSAMDNEWDDSISNLLRSIVVLPSSNDGEDECQINDSIFSFSSYGQDPLRIQKMLSESKDDILDEESDQSYTPTWFDTDYHNQERLPELFPYLPTIEDSIQDQYTPQGALNQTTDINLSFIIAPFINNDSSTVELDIVSYSDTGSYSGTGSESDEDEQSENVDYSNRIRVKKEKIKNSISKNKKNSQTKNAKKSLSINKKHLSPEVYNKFKKLYVNRKGTKKYVVKIMDELNINSRQYATFRDRLRKELKKEGSK